ncbi:MAG: LysE family translocator [Pseudomonadota bacterium]
MVSEILSIAGLTVLIMISPGPDLALVARNTVLAGKVAGGWTSVGILTGNLVHLSYCLLGIGWLIANSVFAFTILKLAGGAYLIYLGFQSFRSDSGLSEDTPVTASHQRQWWIQGLLNNLLNPKGPLFYLGILAVFVKTDSSIGQIAILVITTIGVSALFWIMFVYVLQITHVRNQLMRVGQTINRVLGSVLVLLGLRLWFSEATKL